MEIIYQVLPRIWGSGKFKDWDTSTFEYLKSLNITAVWFTGIIRHSTAAPWVKGNPGSPYSISDYYDVNPYLAVNPDRRMEEFRALVERTHRAGFKVIIDLVPNHVAPDCKDVPVHDWYDYDWSDTRKIDYGHPDTWKKMLDIALFWAGLGVDGFRCDMVEMVPLPFLGWLISEVRKAYPRFIFIGEAYDTLNYRPLIKEAGFDLLYDKSGLYDTLRAIICNGASVRNITYNWQRLQEIQPDMLNFLENHDEQRFASPFFAGDPFKGIPALAAGALFNRASFMIYAGQETGTAAGESENGRTSIFNWTRPEELAQLYSFIHGKTALEPWRAQLLQRYRAILSFLSDPLFRDGANYDLCWCNSVAGGFDPDRHFIFLRYLKQPRKRYARAALVACNFSGSPVSMTVNIPDDLRAKKELARLPSRVSLELGAWDAAVKDAAS